MGRGGLLRWGCSGADATGGSALLTEPLTAPCFWTGSRSSTVGPGVVAALGVWAREPSCEMELATMVRSSSMLSWLCAAGEADDGDAEAPATSPSKDYDYSPQIPKSSVNFSPPADDDNPDDSGSDGIQAKWATSEGFDILSENFLFWRREL